MQTLTDRVTDLGEAVGAMEEHPAFSDIGKRMLLAWEEGINGLRNKK